MPIAVKFNVRSRRFCAALSVPVALAALVVGPGAPVGASAAHTATSRTRTTTQAAAPATTSPTVVNPFGVFGGKASNFADDVTALGATRTVVPVDWRVVQPAPPKHTGNPVLSDYNFHSLDNLVSSFGAHGIQVEFRLFTCAVNKDGSDFWATIPEPDYVRGSRDSGNCTTMPPKDSATLYSLVYNLMAHFATTKYPVTFIAIENEINDHTQWPGVTGATACSLSSCPMLDAYLQVLQTARSAAHAANPNAVVLDSGLGSRMFGYGYARAGYEADVKASGFSSATLIKWATYLNYFLAYRRTPDNHNPALYLDTTQPTDQLLAQFNSLVYAPFNPDASPAQIVDTGDRAYYLYTHMYANASLLDAVQLHAYDQVDDFPAFLSYIQAQLHASDPAGRPLMCWECGIIVPLTGNNHNQIANFDANTFAGLVVKRDVEALGGGASQVIHLPLLWNSPPPGRKTSYALPLLCGGNGTKYEPVMCPDNTTLSPNAMGRAYSVLAHSLATFSSPTPITAYGAGVRGYEFALPTGHLAVLWNLGSSPVSVNTTTLGSVTGITDVFGTASTQSTTAYPLTSQPIYVHLT